MKSQRRHELQENVLGSELAQIANFFKEKGTAIVVGLLAVAVIAAIVAYAYGSIRDKQIKLRNDFDQAMKDRSISPEQRVATLERLSGQDDNKRIAAESLVALGDEYSRRMLVAGPTADAVQWKGFADLAEGYYRRAVETYPDQQAIVGRARFGMAKLAEGREDFETARGEYRAVLDMSGLEGYPVHAMASRALADLEDLTAPAPMATTAPAEPETQPATQSSEDPPDEPTE